MPIMNASFILSHNVVTEQNGRSYLSLSFKYTVPTYETQESFNLHIFVTAVEFHKIVVLAILYDKVNIS